MNKFYDEYLQGKYNKYLIEYDPQFRESIFKKYFETIKDKYPIKGSLLDIGCAVGSLLKIVSSDGWDVSGIEISPYAGEIAGQYGKVYIGDVIERLSGIDNTFDVITFIDSLEHFSSPRKVLETTFFKLKKNGFVFIEIPNGDSAYDEMSRHFYMFTKSTINKLLKMIGYRDVIFLNLKNYKYNFSDSEETDRFIHLIAYK